MKFEKQNQHGRSMIEMLGVLAIIGVLSVGGIAGFSKAMAKYRVNKTIDQITMISTNVRTLFASQRSYSGMSSWFDAGRSLIMRAKLVPDEVMEITNGELTGLRNPYGGDLHLAADSRDYKAFTITLENIPMESCIALATNDWPDDLKALAFGPNLYDRLGSTNGALYECCTINRDTCNRPKEQGTYMVCRNLNEMPVSVSDATIGCDCPNGNCIMHFTFK